MGASETLSRFVGKSKTFDSFSFKGCYGMSLITFTKLFNHFTKTGENLLDAYSEFIYLTWENPEENRKLYTYDHYEKIDNYLSSIRRLRIVDSEIILQQRDKIKVYRRRYEDYLESLKQAPRKDACKHTGKEETKKAVLDYYNEKRDYDNRK